MQIAPIVLFVYNRPWHTKQTIEALQKNELAEESELFIFSDAPKNAKVQKSVDEVRAYIDQVKGFKKVTLIKKEKNWGLADSIIDGVTSIVNKYGKVIVLEDDLVTSPYFLRYMNEALNFYKNDKEVWHISGWNYPISPRDIDDTFLWRVMNCWGWATWSDRWQFFEKDTDKILKSFTKDDIKAFNLDGTENFWAQILGNKKGTMNTWAIFWYATIFKNKGLCLNPTVSLVENIGLDGSGVHCGTSSLLCAPLNKTNKVMFTTKKKEDTKAVKRIKSFYFWQRWLYRFRKLKDKVKFFKGEKY